jgi:hypothetical protein
VIRLAAGKVIRSIKGQSTFNLTVGKNREMLAETRRS